MTRAIRSLPVLVALLLASCEKPPDASQAARKFFDDVAAGRTAAAYESAAFAFKAQQSQTFFEAALRELNLDKIENATFSPAEPEPDGRTAKVPAEFTVKGNNKVPLVVTLTKDDGEWRVFALKSPRSLKTGRVENRFSLVGRAPDFGEAATRQPAPDDAAAKKLVREWMLRFDSALAQKSFAEFFEKCSLAWQDQLVTGEVRPGQPRTMRNALTDGQKEIGTSRLDSAFKPFMDKEVRITAVKDIEPVFDNPPHVTTDGLLVIAGKYPLQPYAVVFTLKFQYEISKWKLFGIDVSLRK